MTEKPIDRLESRLQTLIEGAFARLFRRTVSARDIAILLLRAMEDEATPAAEGMRRCAPDTYQIFLHPDTVRQFVTQYPDLPTRFGALIVDLSLQSGYQLQAKPQVELLASGSLAEHRAIITASHSLSSDRPTKTMPPVPAALATYQAPQSMLMINETKIVTLRKSLVNIGRGSSNDIVIQDAYISRHHLQLRRRFGTYILFDVNSRGGTLVNDMAVRNHRLQNGDVIHIGHSRLIYTDEAANYYSDDSTQVLDLA